VGVGWGGYGGLLVVRVGMNHANSFPMQRDVDDAADQHSLVPSQRSVIAKRFLPRLEIRY
jgi:hypothetical protein